MRRVCGVLAADVLAEKGHGGAVLTTCSRDGSTRIRRVVVGDGLDDAEDTTEGGTALLVSCSAGTSAHP